MKNKFVLTLIAVLLSSIIIFSSCSNHNVNQTDFYIFNTDRNTYSAIDENEFTDVTEKNKEAFISLSVNTAAYTDVINHIQKGNPVPKDAVRIEEMINYFKYDYSLPQNDAPLSFNSAIFDSPWNQQSKLLAVGLRSEEIEERQNQSYNIVLLVDVSGSMYGSDRLSLVKESFCLLVDQFDENDKISLVTYASGTKIVFDGVSGIYKDEIKSMINSISASGATAGGEAIKKAYDIAFKHNTDDNNSCIIMATDGDFNLGISTPEELKELVSAQNQNGVSLSAIGVGFGNMRSDMLESIASSGGGRFGYISSLTDGHKFLIEEIGGIINIVANDAKAKIEFNPQMIKKYRLIGYENRQLTIDEWNDNNTKAGAIGSGMQTTAVFEIILNDSQNNMQDYATVSLRYKETKTSQSHEDLFVLTNLHLNPIDKTDPTIIKKEDQLFIASVIEFGLLLRNSIYKGSASYQNIYDRLKNLDCTNTDIYKMNFLYIIQYLL